MKTVPGVVCMIISCPSCETRFKVDGARLAADGTKVRCSKCGHVWRTMPDGQPASPAQQPLLAMPPADGPAVGVSAKGVQRAGKPSERAEPLLSARDDIGGEDIDRDPEIEVSAGESDEAASSEKEVSAGAGLTGEQRARLKAAGQKRQPGGARFWIKVLVIFILVVGILLVAHKMGMLPTPDLKKAGLAIEQPADVGAVDAKPAPAEPANSGHIIGGEEAANPTQ